MGTPHTYQPSGAAAAIRRAGLQPVGRFGSWVYLKEDIDNLKISPGRGRPSGRRQSTKDRIAQAERKISEIRHDLTFAPYTSDDERARLLRALLENEDRAHTLEDIRNVILVHKQDVPYRQAMYRLNVLEKELDISG